MDLKPLFSPKTIAVIGVSRSNDRHPANVIYSKLHLRYPVKVYPVNPKGGMIQREIVYTDVSEIPDKIDLAVIAARAEYVPDILESCIRAGVGGGTIISGGFAEVGRNDLQQRNLQRDFGRQRVFPARPHLYGASHSGSCRRGRRVRDPEPRAVASGHPTG